MTKWGIAPTQTWVKAEALGLDCSVGFMQRAERVVFLGLGSVVFGLMWDKLVLSGVIVIVAVLTNLTALHRIVWVYKQAAGVPLDSLGKHAGPIKEIQRDRQS